MPRNVLFDPVPQVAPQDIAAPQQRGAPGDVSFGASAFRGLAQLGAGIEKAGETGLDELTARAKLDDEIHASELNTWLSNKVTDRYNEFAQLEGKAAQDALPKYKEDIEGLYKEHIEQSGNLFTKSLLAKNGRYLTDTYYRYGTMHATRQARTWADKTATDRASSFGNQAIVALNNGDENGVNVALNTSDDEVRKLFEQRLYDRESIDAEVAKNRGRNVKALVKIAAEESPVKAQAIYKRYQGSMDAAAQAEVTSLLKSGHARVIGQGIADEESGHIRPASDDIAGIPGGFLGAIKQSEGYTPTAKWDVKQNSVGYGTRARFAGETIDRPEAERRFADEIGKAAKIVDSVNPNLDPGTRAGLTSLTFNTGDAWVSAGLGDAVRKGDLVAARQLFLQYNKVEDASGALVTNAGVAARRYREAQWFGTESAPPGGPPPVDKATAFERVDARTRDNPLVNAAAMARLNQVYAIYHEQQVTNHAGFDLKLRDTTAQALATGSVQTPLTESDFVDRYGVERGIAAHQEYQKTLQLGADRASLATMAPDEQLAVLQKHAPAEGEGFAAQAQRYGELHKEIDHLNAEKAKDPAAFALSRLPTVQRAWASFSDAMNGQGSLNEKRAAVASFAEIMLLEQSRVGIPAERQVLLPKAYIDQFTGMLNRPAAAGGTLAVAQQIEMAAQLWGPHWPMVYRQIGKEAGPLFRVIGSGIPAPAANLLVQLKDLSAGQILKDQSNEKIAPLATAVRDAMVAQFTPTTLGGGERAPVIHDFESQMLKLAAYYQATGAESSSSAAAQRAYKDLIGDKYEFRQTFRIPKQGAPPAAEIDAGARWARANLGALGIASERDNVGVLSPDYLHRATIKAFQRDGVWATSPDEKGLVLIDPATGFAVRRQSDGGALSLTWEQLAMFGRGNPQAVVERAAPSDRLRAGRSARREAIDQRFGAESPQRFGAELDFLQGIGAIGARVNPENWDRMLRETPPSTNIEDRRNETPPPKDQSRLSDRDDR